MTEIKVFESEPTLRELQEAVGGFIEMVPGITSYEGRPCDAVCDEEGLLKGKEVNVEITELAQKGGYPGFIVGNVAIVIGGLR
jgi:hypothetical protein